MNDTSGNQSSVLKNAGLKATVPRQKILEFFQKRSKEPEGIRRHVSAEEIYKDMVAAGDDIGLATVYRVLAQFEEAGIIVHHHFDADHATYELEKGDHHDHLVCTECGKVVEFADHSIEREQILIAKKHGYELNDHILVLYGICPECQKKSKEN